MRHYTYMEYLALEDESQTRHEYLDGEIYAMAGGTPDHAALAAALLAIIGRQLPLRRLDFRHIRTARSCAEDHNVPPTTPSR